MQRLHIYPGDDGKSHWAGLTPEALNEFGEKVIGSARVEILDAPQSHGYALAQRRELAVMLSGIHEFGAAEGRRRLFPGDMLVLEDTSGEGHTFDAIGKERAISLRFDISR